VRKETLRDSVGPVSDAVQPDSAEQVVEQAPRRRYRILYLHPETMGFSAEPLKNPLHYLSRYLQGDYLAIWIVDNAEAARRKAAETRAAHGNFRFHWTRVHRLPFGLRRLWELVFWTATGVGMSLKHGRYDVIVTYGAFSTALAGLMIRALTGTPLIVEFPGHPFRSFDLYPGWVSRLKRRVAPLWATFVARTADHVQLRYPTQLDELSVDIDHKKSVFPNFTTITTMAAYAPDDAASIGRYVLFLGFPFHLKGVDVLIRAFQRISERFPDCRLLIVGYCPDPAPYEELAAGNPKIEIRKPLPHDEAMRLVAGCAVFVLPSRMDAMARVLLEAMGAGRAVVASGVGGIPYYVQHGRTGLLFESEDVEELASHLATLLSDEDYARELGRNARRYVEEYLSEHRYAASFAAMVERVAGS
jgi:glycosyltransferase involved in cell wall biosynthesis